MVVKSKIGIETNWRTDYEKTVNYIASQVTDLSG